MGIRGSATCVLNFDGATGHMIGPKNKGLSSMFTMMNLERKKQFLMMETHLIILHINSKNWKV